MPDPVTAAGVGVALAKTKLGEYAARGAARVLEPMLPLWLERRRAKQKEIESEGAAARLLTEASGQTRSLSEVASGIRELQTDLENTGLVVSEGHISLAEGVEQTIVLRAAERLENIGSMIETAEETLGDKIVSDIAPNPEFTERFFEAGQDVSADELKVLWGRLLADEVARPGLTSLRTLSILRDLDTEVANIYSRFCSLSFTLVAGSTQVVGMGVVAVRGRPSENKLQEFGIGYLELVRLVEHGLIASDFDSWRDYGPFLKIADQLGSVPRDALAIRYAGQEWFLRSTPGTEPREEARLNSVLATHSGVELSRVVEIVPNEQYSSDLRKHLRENHLQLVRFNDGIVL